MAGTSGLCEPLKIVEPLKETITVKEGESVLLECKLNKIVTSGTSNLLFKWYKNSRVIVESETTKLSNDGQWQMLELKSLTKEDEGVYSLIITSNSLGENTMCNIHVATLPLGHVTHYYSEKVMENPTLNVQTSRCVVTEGRYVALKAQFITGIFVCKWYKNDQPVPRRFSQLLIQINDYSQVALNIHRARIEDSGLYTLVAETEDNKFISRCTQVHVQSENESNLLDINVPSIIKQQYYATEAYTGDDITLLFKVNYDNKTQILWFKNENALDLTPRISYETYLDQYIALKLRNVKIKDSGYYRLGLRQKGSSRQVFGQAGLIVTRCPYPRPKLPCTVIKKLVPAIVVLGTAINFYCSFNIPKIKNTYVVWMIGKYTIKMSNETFDLLCFDNTFLLHIRSAVPELCGEVTCQLRQQVNPNGKSILLCKTTSYLTIVPEILLNEPCRIESEKILFYIKHQKKYFSRWDLKFPASETGPLLTNPATREVMYFQIVLINNRYIILEILDKYIYPLVRTITVTKEPNYDRSPYHGECKIEWDRPDKTECYAIDMWQPNGTYKKVGVTSSPKFFIKELLLDNIMRFRIRTYKSGRGAELKFCLERTPAPEKRSYKLKSYKSFQDTFTSKAVAGKFGMLHLQRRRDQECFSGRIIKCEEIIKRGGLPKQLYLVKNLDHPNIAAFIDGYLSDNENKAILVMELPWGVALSEMGENEEILDENELIGYIRQVLSALEYIHSKNIIHLNLQPENIICVNPNSRAIKIVDFSMAREMNVPIKFPIVKEYGLYQSPEMINYEEVGSYSDMWNVGVITYWLLTKMLPFHGNTWLECSENISSVIYDYDDDSNRRISDSAKVFVSYLLRRQPTERLSATMARYDNWIFRGPEQGRPIKVAMRIQGGLCFVDPAHRAQCRWKVLILWARAAVRFGGRTMRGKIGMDTSTSVSE